ARADGERAGGDHVGAVGLLDLADRAARADVEVDRLVRRGGVEDELAGFDGGAGLDLVGDVVGKVAAVDGGDVAGEGPGAGVHLGDGHVIRGGGCGAEDVAGDLAGGD